MNKYYSIDFENNPNLAQGEKNECLKIFDR